MLEKYQEHLGQVGVPGSAIFTQHRDRQRMPWQLQPRLSDLISAAVLGRDLITLCPMAPSTHVDLTEVFAPVGFKAQIAESGWQKSMCFLESGKEVTAPDFRDSNYSSNLLASRCRKAVGLCRSHPPLWQLVMDLPKPSVTPLFPVQVCLGPLESHTISQTHRMC